MLNDSLLDLANSVSSSANRLGRLVSTDPNDRRFPMKAALPKRETTITRRMWNTKMVLNQGNTPQCVGYAWEGFLLAGPVKNLRSTPGGTAIYTRAQQLDEWEGESYDGTSVRGGAKALAEFEYLHEYRWATEADTVARWILETSPVVVGTNWTTGMDTPDKDGYLHYEGANYGGHAYLLVGVNLARRNPDDSRGAVRMVNSWGPGWGENGRAWISLLDLDKLIKDWGEACAATEIRKPVKK